MNKENFKNDLGCERQWSLLDKVVVIITTRNRKDALLTTVQRCLEMGLRQSQLFITDDASTDGTPEAIRQSFPEITLQVNSRQLGLIHNRNYMMANSTNDFILSLDDDSNLINADDLKEALSLLNSKEEYGVFGFTPVEQLQTPPAKNHFSHEIFLSKWYIGCGHIIKRSVFNRIGHYREIFVFYGEEIDFSARCFKEGIFVIRKHNLIVHHRVDYQLRHTQLMANSSRGEYGMLWRRELSMTNRVTHILLYYPLLTLPYYLSKALIGHFYIYCIRNNWNSSFWKALNRLYKRSSYIRKERNPFSFKEFSRYIKLHE